MALTFKRAACSLLVICASAIHCFGSATNKALIYSDFFEDYDNGAVLHDTNGWFTHDNGAVVQMDYSYSGEKAARILPDHPLTNQVDYLVSTNIMFETYMQVNSYSGPDQPTVDVDSTALFYINSSGRFVVWDGAVPDWVEITNDASGEPVSPVPLASWMKLDVLVDYSAKTWSLVVEDNLLIEGVGFFNAGQETIGAISFLSGSGNVYIDDFSVYSYSISPLPDLDVSTSSIDISAMVGNVATSSFEVYNVNNRGVLEFEITSGTSWIKHIEPVAGTSSGTGVSDRVTVNFECDATGLTPGISNGTIRVTGVNQATGEAVLGSPRDVRITLDIYTSPELSISASSLANTVPQGYDAEALSFDLWNSGDGSLGYTITDSVPWMAVSPATGVNYGDREPMSVIFSTANLDPGMYSAVIGVKGVDNQFGDEAVNSPQYINLTLEVKPRAVLQCSVSELSGNIIQGNNLDAHTFTIANDSIQPKGSLTYALSESIDWLFLSSTGGVVAADAGDTITVSYNTGYLTPGTYYGLIKIDGIDVLTDDEAVNSPNEIEVFLHVRPTPSGDFDGTGKSSLVVYNEATGEWFVRSVEGDVLVWAVEFGGPGYRPVAGEYLGEGRMNFGVYREATGMWFVRAMDSSYVRLNVNCGGRGFTPVHADFDGDGLRDFAVYHEASGYWYAINSASGSILAWAEQFGGPGFVPVPADFDGDGITDLGVYELATGNWYLQKLRGPVILWGEQWGGQGHLPVVGDFSGNGQADIAVYNEMTGAWYIRTVGGSLIAWDFVWGGRDFSPVVGDYVGDGLADLAVYNRVTGKWYIYHMSGSVVVWDVMWGGPGFSAVGSMD